MSNSYIKIYTQKIICQNCGRKFYQFADNQLVNCPHCNKEDQFIIDREYNSYIEINRVNGSIIEI